MFNPNANGVGARAKRFSRTPMAFRTQSTPHIVDRDRQLDHAVMSVMFWIIPVSGRFLPVRKFFEPRLSQLASGKSQQDDQKQESSREHGILRVKVVVRNTGILIINATPSHEPVRR